MSRACSLKGNQKLFFLQLNEAASCCRAHPISLSGKTLDQCVELWDSESDQLEQGNKISSCKHCWDMEDRGEQSYRQQFPDFDLNQIDIYSNNLCNQMCSYCAPRFSSTWENSIRQHGNFELISKAARDNLSIPSFETDVKSWEEQIKNHILNAPNGVTIKLLGGEPLMQKQNLQKFLDFDTDKIKNLIINTNLNPPNSKFLEWTLENFPREKLKFRISLDTVPEYNHEPRAGFNKHQFNNNLELLKKNQVEFVFLSAVSVLSVFTVNEYHIWLNKNGYQSIFFKLNNPDCLSPTVLPQWAKDKLYNEELPVVVKESLSFESDNNDLRLIVILFKQS